jgi:hypothetical protein
MPTGAIHARPLKPWGSGRLGRALWRPTRWRRADAADRQPRLRIFAANVRSSGLVLMSSGRHRPTSNPLSIAYRIRSGGLQQVEALVGDPRSPILEHQRGCAPPRPATTPDPRRSRLAPFRRSCGRSRSPASSRATPPRFRDAPGSSAGPRPAPGGAAARAGYGSGPETREA